MICSDLLYWRRIRMCIACFIYNRRWFWTCRGRHSHIRIKPHFGQIFRYEIVLVFSWFLVVIVKRPFNKFFDWRWFWSFGSDTRRITGIAVWFLITLSEKSDDRYFVSPGSSSWAFSFSFLLSLLIATLVSSHWIFSEWTDWIPLYLRFGKVWK